MVDILLILAVIIVTPLQCTSNTLLVTVTYSSSFCQGLGL